MAKIINEHTKLTLAEAREFGQLVAEWQALRGTYNSPAWNLIKGMQPEFSAAGLGKVWPEFIADSRAVVAKARAAVAAL